jgi:ATP phosphoribosyltransferase regulatory subunit HisZ
MAAASARSTSPLVSIHRLDEDDEKFGSRAPAIRGLRRLEENFAPGDPGS